VRGRPRGICLILAACACASAAPPPAAPAPPSDRPDWHRRVVVYHAWVRSFLDSDGDGVGDLRGFASKLDYLRSLGVGALLLSPVHPSPGFDSGYDVQDYRAIHADFGSLADYDALVRAAHARGLRVLLDFVLNHTSDRHAWFEASRAPGDPKRGWYMWAAAPDLPCGPADPVFGPSAWTQDAGGDWYFHHFYPQQPDLDYRNPEVAAEMLDTARFWLDRGVDGLRLDAVQTLVEDEPGHPSGPDFVCRDHPLTHAFLKRLRATTDAYPDRVLLGEVGADARTTAAYFGSGADELHATLSVDAEVGIFSGLTFGDPAGIPVGMRSALAALPQGAQLALFLSNHDRGRVSRYAGADPARLATAAALLLTLPGTPMVYYGDEIGMRSGTQTVVDERDAARTPMQWTGGSGAGFTSGTPWIAPAPDLAQANVEAQERDAGSLLATYRRLVAMRNRLDLFGTADFVPLSAEGPMLVYARREGARGALVAVNFSDAEASAIVDLSAVVTAPARVEISTAPLPAPRPAGASAFAIDLPARGFAIWSW